MIVTYYDNMHPHYDKMQNPYRDENNDIWEGRKPHNIDAETGVEEYRVWFGDARISKDGELLVASASLNHKVNVFICGDSLRMIDIRYAGKIDSWGYSIRNGMRVSVWPSNHLLEDERIDSMLRKKNIDCPLWVKICNRAREMWLEEIGNRDALYRYTPEYND